MKTMNSLRNSSSMMGFFFALTLFASCSKESDIRPFNPVIGLSATAATTDNHSEARLNNSTARPDGAMNRNDVLKPQLDPVSGLGVQFTDSPDIKTDEGKLISKPSEGACRLCEQESGSGASIEEALHGFAPIR